MLDDCPIASPEQRLETLIETPPPEIIALLAEISRKAAAAREGDRGELVSAETPVLRDLSVYLYGPYDEEKPK